MSYYKAPLQIEIIRHKNAIDRYEKKINKMDETWYKLGSICCPSCAYGYTYNDLCNKIKRTRQQYEKLLAKANKLNLK